MSAGIGFNGLISGLDTNAIVQALLQADRAPLTTLNNRREDILARNEAVSTIKSRLSTLQGSLTSLKLESTLGGRSVTLSGTDASAVSVSANSKAALGSYKIGVERLATSTRSSSSAPLGQAIDPDEVIKDANFGTAITSGSFKINGVEISVDNSVDTLNDVINRINASGTGVTASLVNDAYGRANVLQIDANTPTGAIQLGAGSDTSNFLTSTKIDAAPRVGDSITATGGLGAARTSLPLNQADLSTPVAAAGTLTINGVEVDYDPAVDSLNDVIARINASDSGVTAGYDAAGDSLVFTNKKQGALLIDLADTGNFLSATGLDNPAAQALGQSAKFTVNGTTYYANSNTVSSAVPGLTITLKGETTTDVTAGVSVDTSGALDKLKTFVENFNMALGQLTVATRTTESERGLLAGDGTIRSMRESLRRFITSPAEGLNGSLSTFASIGLTFGNIGSAVGTTTDLKLDEAKFREALEANPTAVHDLFAAKPRGVLSSVGDVTAASGTPNEYAVSGTYQIDSDGAGNFTVTFTDVNSVVYPPRQVTVTPGTSSSELVPGMTIETSAAPTGTSSTVTVTHREGIVERVDSYLKGLLGSSGVFASRQSQVDGQIKAIDDQILRQEERIASREEALQRQFSALEVTLSRLQSQSSALSSTLLSLQNSANSNN
jgi:flagellar hook-associated protein 2